jgi:hypothetical protein
VNLTAKDAYIEAEFDPKAQPCRLTLQDMRETIEGWQAFLQQGKKG